MTPDGAETVMLADPDEASNDAGTCATNVVELMKDVVRGVPFQSTTIPEVKPEPVTVSVTPCPPAADEEGERLVIVGEELCVLVIVKVSDKSGELFQEA